MDWFRRTGSIIQRKKRSNILCSIEYPVIICNSFENLYRGDIDDDSTVSNIDDNFQLEVNYAYLDLDQRYKREYFLIDILDFNKIDEFLTVLQNDANSIINIIWHIT